MSTKMNSKKDRKNQPSHFTISVFKDEHRLTDGDWGWSARAEGFLPNGRHQYYETVPYKTPAKALKALAKKASFLNGEPVPAPSDIAISI